MSGLSTCGAPEEESRAVSGPAPDADVLWVSAVEQDGTMAPIARYADGVWDSPPWAGIFVLEQIVAVRMRRASGAGRTRISSGRTRPGISTLSHVRPM